MNKILDSRGYKRMKENVLRELQLKLLGAKLHDKTGLQYSDLSEREVILEGLIDYFNNFFSRLPDWPRRVIDYGIAGKRSEDIPKSTRDFFKLKERVKELTNETGLNRNELAELTEVYLANNGYENYLSFVDYVFPVYVALRMEGYNHYPDLTA